MDYLAIYKRLFAIAEAGLVYGKDAFDRERYTELQQLSLQLIQQLGNEPFEVIEELFAHEIGYQTPKIDVRAFITKQNKVLLVQDTKTKEWSLLVKLYLILKHSKKILKLHKWHILA